MDSPAAATTTAVEAATSMREHQLEEELQCAHAEVTQIVHVQCVLWMHLICVY